MRHRKAGLKLNRTASHRNAMFRNMVTSLFKHERIQTTSAKAKELRRWADHIITLAKRGDLHARRQAFSIVREKEVVHKLFAEAAERFGGSAGGYTRVVKLGRRQGDAAPIALVELVVPEVKPKMKKAMKKPTKAAVDKRKVAAADSAAPEESKADAETKKTTDKKPAARQKKEVIAKKAAPAKDTKPAAKKEKAGDKKETKTETKAKKAAIKPAADAKTEKKAEKKSTAKTKKKDAEEKK
jgi:large subunit ribosomal protein L17